MRGTSKERRLQTRFGVIAALMAVLALALPAGASALGLGETEEFFAPEEPGSPNTLVEGPDGNVWFTEVTETKIGRVTPSGEVKKFGTLSSAARGITVGPDENVWFAEVAAKKIGYIKPSEPGAGVTECPALASTPTFLTTGSDGNLWVLLPTADKIARVTTACAVTEFSLPAASTACSITLGSDENVWFGDCGTPKSVGRITPSGEVKQFEITGTGLPNSIALGSDENIWFPTSFEEGGKPMGIGKVTPSGTVTYHQTPTLGWTSVASGPDGNVWAKGTSSTAGVSNESQTVTVKATGGTFKLKFNGSETGGIAYNASAAVVEAALLALPTIGAGNVSVSEPATSEWRVTFIGKFKRTDVELMSGGNCNAGKELTGGEESCSVTVFGEASPMKLLRITPAGKTRRFPLPAATELSTQTTQSLAAGPGGSLWYTAIAPKKAIGKFGTEEAFDLKVTKEGTGDGTVVSSPAGIECGTTCEEDFAAGKAVTLTASPDSESLFVSWKGCDVGGVNGRQCKVTGGLNAIKSVSAKFIQAYDVSVARKGTGLGKVQSSPGGILCLSNCASTSAAFKEAASVTLTAVPSKYFTFAGWSGDCEGTGTCVLSALSADKSVEAEFLEVAKHLLSVSKKGGGQGTVKANLAGINCGLTCSSMAALYYQGQEVELTQVAGKGSTFGGWSGACTGTGACKVTISAAKEVQAEFK